MRGGKPDENRPEDECDNGGNAAAFEPGGVPERRQVDLPVSVIFLISVVVIGVVHVSAVTVLGLAFEVYLGKYDSGEIGAGIDHLSEPCNHGFAPCLFPSYCQKLCMG